MLSKLQIWMEVEWCVAKKPCILHWENDREPWQGGNCACKGVGEQNRQLSLFPLLARTVPRCSWGPPPPSLGTARCQPWCQLQIPPTSAICKSWFRGGRTHILKQLHSHFLHKRFQNPSMLIFGELYWVELLAHHVTPKIKKLWALAGVNFERLPALIRTQVLFFSNRFGSIHTIGDRGSRCGIFLNEYF